MERLTTTNKDVTREMICRNEDCGVKEEHCPHLMEDECACLREVINKLADYEDAEEQGLLLRLPVAVGGTICTWEYPTIVDEKGEEWTVCDIKRARVVTKPFNLFMLQEIGHLYFLTREEAESALAEKGGE